MKTMRKLFTVLLALAMTLALAVPAFAADTTGSITITNPQGDRTYTAYKIFDVTYSGKNYSYTISGTDAAFNTVKAYADEAANVSIDAAAFSAASFAQYLKTNVGSLGTGTAFTKDGDTMKASGLTPGYYFVSGTSGTVCELATAKDIEIRDKNEALQIEKSVDDADRTVEIGQKLTYTITGKVPSTKGYTKFTYQVTDTMSEGLTFNKDVKVTIGGTSGYIRSDYVSGGADSKTGYIKGNDVRLRSGAGTSYSILGTYNNGTPLTITGTSGDWTAVTINGVKGYVNSAYVSTTKTEGGNGGGSTPSTSIGETIVATAKQYMGAPYVYGGMSPSGFDCSGFVNYVYKLCGYSMSRVASSIYNNNGTYVEKANLQIGDLVFFASNSSSIGHVGIYIGNGQFIHSSSGAGCVVISDLSSNYYLKNYVGAKRIAG